MVFCLFFFFIKWQKSLLPLTGRVKTFQIEGNSIDIGGKKIGKEKKLQNKEKQNTQKKPCLVVSSSFLVSSSSKLGLSREELSCWLEFFNSTGSICAFRSARVSANSFRFLKKKWKNRRQHKNLSPVLSFVVANKGAEGWEFGISRCKLIYKGW